MPAKKFLLSVYLWLRLHVFEGLKLSRVQLIRNVNFAIEKFLLGEAQSKVTKHELILWLDPRESVSEKIHSYEPESTRLLKRYLRPGSVFIDIGASIGWFSLIAAKHVGPSGRVYAFEPEPHSFMLLKKNIEANGFYEVVMAYQAAVSDKNGKVKLYVTGNAWTWSSLDDPRKDPERRINANFRENEDRSVQEYEVKSVRLDDCLSGRVDFIKIDVEADWVTEEVFHGAQKTILRNPGVQLLIEHPTEAIVTSLKNLGYSYRFVDGLNGFFCRETI